MSNIWAAVWRNTSRRLQNNISQSNSAIRSSFQNSFESRSTAYCLQRSSACTYSTWHDNTVQPSLALTESTCRGQSTTNATRNLARQAFSTKPRFNAPKSVSKRSDFQRIVSHDGSSKVGVNSAVTEPGSPEEFRAVDEAKIAELFGHRVSKELGNEILYTLQGQRATGTLDHGVAATGINDDKIAGALIWLRENYPIDEDAAIIKRIEDEDREAEQQLIANAQRIGLYHPQQDVASTGIYGKSELEEIRKRNEEKLTKSLQADEIRHAATDPDSLALQAPQGRVALSRRTESAEWVKRYKEKALLSKAEKPPDMKKTARLLPAAIFCAAVITSSFIFAQNYIPPPQNARILPDTPPAAATILTIIATNAVIFLVWRMPPMWRFLNKYFLMVPGSLRPFSLIGNVFSHQSPWHLAINMAGFWFIGTQLHDEIGRGNFLALFLTCGTFASFFSFSYFVLVNNLAVSSLGASGALCGMIAALCVLHSGGHFRIVFLPADRSPMISTDLILFALITLEIFGMARGWGRRKLVIDRFAHLGGYLSGISCALAIKRQRRRQKNMEVERRKKLGLIDHIKKGRLGP
ncbi:MAG: hypothetical protein MMC33_008316 [Icmadophila ericetorum]|nr:hypothetical protein [Icmadophila ericetorum]